MKKDERNNAKGQITCILEYLRSWLLYVNSMGRVCRIGRTSHTFESKHTYMDYVWGKNQRHMRGGRKGHRGRGNRMTMLFRTDRMRAKGKSLHLCHWGTNTRARPLPNAPVFGWCWTRWKCKVCGEQHITCRWLRTVSPINIIEGKSQIKFSQRSFYMNQLCQSAHLTSTWSARLLCY